MRKATLGIVGGVTVLFSGIALAQEGIPGTNARLDDIGSTLSSIESVAREIRDAGVSTELTDRLDDLITLVDEIKDASSLDPIGDRLDIAIDRLEDIRDAVAPESSGTGLVQSYRLSNQWESGQVSTLPGTYLPVGGNARAKAVMVSFQGGEAYSGLPGEFSCVLEICTTVSGVCNADPASFLGANRIRVNGSHLSPNVRIDFPAPMAVYSLGLKADFDMVCGANVALFFIND